MTALPIIETEEQNMSAYIPTNLISITDGQIYLSPSLFSLGILPAVDVGKSVSRVGGKAQRSAYRKVSGALKLAYAQFEELETFARFGARLDASSLQSIEHGQRIRSCLKQAESSPQSVAAQIVILLALTNGLFDSIDLAAMDSAQSAAIEGLTSLPQSIIEKLEQAETIEEHDKHIILDMLSQTLKPFTESTLRSGDKAQSMVEEANG
jgi:F-type H+-transporting ATPase subunit alpha